MRGWRITKDLINNPLVDWLPTREGCGYGKAGGGITFFLFDDDGILYFVGEAWDEADVEDAHDFGVADAGVTNLWIDKGDGLEPFIG